MVIGKPLYFRYFMDGHILFLGQKLHLGNPFPGPGQIIFFLADFHHPQGMHHIVAQIPPLVFSMHIILETAFHLFIYLHHLWRNAKSSHNFVQLYLLHQASVLFVEIKEDTVYYKMLRYGESENPLIIQAIVAVFCGQDIFQQNINI